MPKNLLQKILSFLIGLAIVAFGVWAKRSKFNKWVTTPVLIVSLVTGGFFISRSYTDEPFAFAAGNNMWIMCVAGGGGGGSGDATPHSGGGGGSGGVREVTTQAVTGTSYTITVGGKGAANTNGNNSSFGGLVACVGGGEGALSTGAAGNGGSGGGSGSGSNGTGTAGEGANGCAGETFANGGGGGPGSACTAGAGAAGGNGAGGQASSITGSSVTYGGGGGGGRCSGTGGSGGGQGGAAGAGGGAGGANATGYGGGGGGASCNFGGGTGSDGVVIVSWVTADFGTISCTGTLTTSGANSICTFNTTDSGESFTPVLLATAIDQVNDFMEFSIIPAKPEDAPVFA